MDTVGVDTGTDTLAEFIRNRTTAGSYHDIADSDSNLHLIEHRHGAYHDGTGSNNWALSISFVCRTADWDRMSPERRRGFLHQGALAFARQQDYRRRVGAPLTELRLITKAQSDRGESGFTYHGFRDPGRRTDPGVAAPNDFPFAEFIQECRAVLSGAEPAPPHREDDDAMLIECEYTKTDRRFGIYSGGILTGLAGAERKGFDQQVAKGATVIWVNPSTWDLLDRRGQMLVGEIESPVVKALRADLASPKS